MGLGSQALAKPGVTPNLLAGLPETPVYFFSIVPTEPMELTNPSTGLQIRCRKPRTVSLHSTNRVDVQTNNGVYVGAPATFPIESSGKTRSVLELDRKTASACGKCNRGERSIDGLVARNTSWEQGTPAFGRR